MPIDPLAKEITERSIEYYKSIRDPKELEEVPIDILRAMYLDVLQNDKEMKKEHHIMKRFICTTGMWNDFLNYDEFLKYLREDYEGDRVKWEKQNKYLDKKIMTSRKS
jgi:hypothetical protein